MKRWRGDGVAVLGLATACVALGLFAAAASSTLFVDFGPNDGDYVRGFREGWEREGRTRFHWTQHLSTVALPFRVAGDGATLRMRVRRHLIEPARVTVSVEGVAVLRADVQADLHVPYRTLETSLGRLQGRHPLVITIESQSSDPRPLGLALDWLEVERGRSRFIPLPGLLVRLLLCVVAAYLLPRVSGLPRMPALAPALLLLAAAVAGLGTSPLAVERIVREGTAAFVVVGLVLTAAARWLRSRETPAWIAGTLVVIGLAAMAVRLWLLLHPNTYYPDVKVHALFAYELSKRGFLGFLEGFTESQYRFSLGLQLENGHWYAFPYPPAFYILCLPLIRWLAIRPEVAVSILAAAVNTIELLLTFWLGRRLTRSAAGGLMAALAHAVLPLFFVRLALAYFPALVGHAVDLGVLLCLLGFLTRSPAPRPVAWAGLAGLLALALLAYTQAVVNFAVVLGLFLVVDVIGDRTAEARKRQLAIVATGLLGATIALAVFYGRYVPIFMDMRRGVPMAEESILLEKQARERPSTDEAVPDDADPHAGPELDLWRGLRKAGHRIRVFYGPLTLFLVAGTVLLVRHSAGVECRYLLSWWATYFVLNLASGGLPGPNWLRYNKDHEVVAPLFCALAALSLCWLRAQKLGRLWATIGVGVWVGYGLWRGYLAFVGRLVPIDR